MKKSSHASSGFTLIELMVTIVVLGIIVSIAAPNISTQLANQRVKSTTATLLNTLREARAESSIRRQPVTVTYINDAESSNVNIQVPALLSTAYLSPSLFPSAAVSRNWTSLFMSSAMAANENACEICAKTGAPGQYRKCNGGDTDSGDLDSKLVSIAAYKYSEKTLIKSDSKQIIFYPNKRTDKDASFIYTICDSNNSVSPRQITVSKFGNISSTVGGTCP